MNVEREMCETVFREFCSGVSMCPSKDLQSDLGSLFTIPPDRRVREALPSALHMVKCCCSHVLEPT